MERLPTLLSDIANPHHLAFEMSYAREQGNQYDESHYSNSQSTSLVTTSTCLKDDENFLLSGGMHGRFRMKFIWQVVWSCTWNVDITLRTWLELLGGNTGDDVWLWLDGDEKEAEEKYRSISLWETPTDGQWNRAVSALSERRKRGERNQEESAHLAERRQRVQEADPSMRFLMIAWLIVTSEAIREADTSRGLSNREIWELEHLIEIWATVCWVEPSTQAIPDDVFQTFCNAMSTAGHTCHNHHDLDRRKLRQWIWMRSLLHPLQHNEVVCLSISLTTESSCLGCAARCVISTTELSSFLIPSNVT